MRSPIIELDERHCFNCKHSDKRMVPVAIQSVECMKCHSINTEYNKENGYLEKGWTQPARVPGSLWTFNLEMLD